MDLLILGAPRTKKTSNRVLRFGRFNKIVPSEAYLAWRDEAVSALFAQRLASTLERVPCGACDGEGTVAAGKRRATCPRCKGARHQAPPIAAPVNAAATFYRDAERGDLVGYMQGLADALEEAGVVADDKFIRGWDRSRLDKDSARPRVEVTLTPMER